MSPRRSSRASTGQRAEREQRGGVLPESQCDGKRYCKRSPALSLPFSHAFAGRVVAIMGSSGAGKTTLLNALSGRLKVGEVTRLQISREDPSRVDVLVSIDQRTPVKTDERGAHFHQIGQLD